MSPVSALAVLAELRRDEFVVCTMGSARDWPRLSRHERDFLYLPSSMGQAPLIGLGLALAQPDKNVWVFNGDGCMLMNLGALVTIAAAGATNYTLVVLDNGRFEVTGGQLTAATTQTDFAALARGAGITSAASFNDLESWKRDVVSTLRLPGPRFISLAVESVGDDYQLPTPLPMSQRVAAFRQAIL